MSSIPSTSRSVPHPVEPFAATDPPNALELAWIGLGSNLGDRRALLEDAVRRISLTPGVHWRALSSIRETEPIGGPPQGAYLNAVGALETTLSPRELLARLLEIEAELGRVRGVRFGPRTVDLDLLLFADRVIEEDGLIVPHPRMVERSFVLDPLVELAADRVHPVLGVTIAELQRRLVRAEGSDDSGGSRAHHGSCG